MSTLAYTQFRKFFERPTETMFNILFFFYFLTRFFKRSREILSNLVSICYRKLFGIKPAILENITTPKALLRVTLSKLGWLISFVVLIQIFSPYIDPYLVSCLTYLASLLTGKDINMPKQIDYGTLLAAVIGVGGVFIGLYYTAISGVCSAIYANKPNNVRNLLARDRVSTFYMNLISMLTCFGVFLLGLNTLGYQPAILAMLLLLLGSGWMIFGFIQLGRRAFNLFDPTTFSDTIFERLRRHSKRMQAGGYHWSNQSIQKRSHNIAQTEIDTLITLSDITAKEIHLNGRPFADMCQSILSFLLDYEATKKSIPTNSLWYRQRYVHPDWYRTDHTKTSLAYDTATGLRPEVVSDPRWIESAILSIVRHCLEINMEEKRYPIVIELLNRLDVYVRLLAAEHQIEYAFNLISDIFSSCEKLIFAEEESLVTEEPLEHMQICAQLATMPINVLLAYVRAIESYGPDTIRQHIRDITWKSEYSIYRSRFAGHVLQRLEWMRPRLEFEERVEGHIITPIWYLQELVSQKEAENYHTAMLCFYEKIGQLYKPWIESATTSKHSWLAAVILSEESEYWNKLDYYRNVLNQFWNDLNSDRKAEKISWPSLDADELKEKSEQRGRELLELMSKENLLLSLISKPESYPDFAGQFLHTVGEALLHAMCENDCDVIEALFNRYSHGSLLQFEQLRTEEAVSDRQQQVNLKVAVDPLLDLMDMSGYAYLLSEYHDAPGIKEPIIKAWNEYLDRDQGESRLQFLASAVSLSEAVFGIAPRDINRTRWQQIISQCLSDVERQEIPPDPNRITVDLEPRTIPVHQSPLVRIFARHPSYIRLYDGIDIFIAKYVRQREDGENLNFRGRRRDLREEIHREERHATRNEES